MKRCKRCGRELDESSYNKSSSSSDGLQTYCRSCQHEMARSWKERKQNERGCNPDLAKVTPRQLIEELKARGYTGELKSTQVIKL